MHIPYMTGIPFFKNRKSRRELEAEIDQLQTARAAQASLLGDLNKYCERYAAEVAGLRKELEASNSTIPKIELIPSPNLTLAKWLREENLIASAATILKHPDMRAMLDVLRNEHPGKKGLAITATMEQRAAYQAETQGYERCLSYLQALGEKPKKKTEIEETFAEENVVGGKSK